MKPSIFSKDYEKKIRMIRIRRITIVLVLIAICIIGYLNYSKNINLSAIKNNIKSAFTFNTKKKGKVQNKKTTAIVKKPNTKSKTKPAASKEQSYTVKMSNGDEIKAVYGVKDNSANFKYILPIDSKVDFSISPSGKAIVFYDKDAQSILYMGGDGNTTDITKNDYKSESDGTVYTKADELKKVPSFVWCTSPKFIDDNTVAFVSQLPYLNQNGQQYIWIYNITTKEYNCLYNNAAGSIKFDKLTDKGLTVMLDNNTKFLKSDGTLQD